MTDEERKKRDEFVEEFVHTTSVSLHDILTRENGIVAYTQGDVGLFHLIYARIIQAATVNWLLNLKSNMENHIEPKEYVNGFMDATVKDIADSYYMNHMKVDSNGIQREMLD